MIRFGEVAQQVRERAGDYQIPLKTGKALGHAYGGGSQFFSMWVVGNEKPTSGPDSRSRPGAFAPGRGARFGLFPGQPKARRSSKGWRPHRPPIEGAGEVARPSCSCASA
jgi:hypothetical protein